MKITRYPVGNIEINVFYSEKNKKFLVQIPLAHVNLYVAGLAEEKEMLKRDIYSDFPGYQEVHKFLEIEEGMKY